MLIALLRYLGTIILYVQGSKEIQYSIALNISNHIYRVKARHAEAFVSLIVKNGKDFKFLSFFKVIPVASGIPIKANQLLVLRMLASNAANTMPQIPYRGTIANSSEILYHAALLDILGLCSYGMFGG